MNIETHIDNYTKSVFALADALYSVKMKLKKNSNIRLMCTIYNMDKSKITQLCDLGSMTVREYSLLPEHHYEVMKLPVEEQKKYLRLAVEKQLKPTELRKIIRASKKNVVSKDKSTYINTWSKHLMMLQNQIKQMPPSTRERALAHIANTILL